MKQLRRQRKPGPESIRIVKRELIHNRCKLGIVDTILPEFAVKRGYQFETTEFGTSDGLLACCKLAHNVGALLLHITPDQI